MKLWFTLAAVVLAACQTAPVGPPRLEPLWTLEGLASPESVLRVGDALLVSNVNGEGDAKDGNGFVARVSTDGRLLQREWARGLDAPKGMAVHGGRLFVSDIDAIAEIDAASGAVIARHAVAGANFLNDVAALSDGTILVADSGGARIYALRQGSVSVWLADELLNSINGLLVDGDRVLVTTMRGRMLSVDARTKAITPLAEGLADADGVAVLGRGRYLVTEWPGRLFYVETGGATQTLLDTRDQNIYLNDILLVGDVLLIPNWRPGTLSAYRVSR